MTDWQAIGAIGLMMVIVGGIGALVMGLWKLIQMMGAFNAFVFIAGLGVGLFISAYLIDTRVYT